MKRYLKITQESAFGTVPEADPISIWLRIPDANAFRPMTEPEYWRIMSGSGFAVPALTGTQTARVAGTLTTPLTAEQASKLVLAYEPVWAIGTGLTATPEQAQAAHAFIRKWLGETFGEATAGRIVVQYGGSVKPDNAQELLACPDIDGALVGGASLKATDFLAIIKAGQAVTSLGKL